MPSTATTRLRLEKQATGSNVNTWGAEQNTAGGSDLIDEAIAGRTAFALSGSKTLSSTNFASDEARKAFLDVTGGTGGTVTIPAVEKLYLVRNNSSGTVTITTGSGTTAVIASGDVVTVGCDGTNVYQQRRTDYGSALLSSSGTPTTGNHLTNKTYVDATAGAATTSANAAAASASAAATSETNAASSAAGLQGTSTTSVAIATGSKSFTTQSGKQFAVGAFMTIASNAAPTTNWMFGQVTAYSGTGLTVNVTVVGGSGTYTDWNIEVAGAQGAQGPALTNVQTFSSSATWTKPTAGTIAIVECYGGGGGGTSGSRRAAGVAAFSGGGGGGGSYSRQVFLLSVLGATETVTIGAGGNGGAAVSVNDTNGSAGTDGGNTTFGSWLTAYGGKTTVSAPSQGGYGGQAIGGTAVLGGEATAVPSGANSTNNTASGGGGGSGSSTVNAWTPGASAFGGCGGGGGGCIDSANTLFNPSAGAMFGATGGAAGTSGSRPGTAGSAFAGGGGGYPGDTGGTVAGGTGGVGGVASGGGGGGSSRNGANSGAGGAGGAGYCRVTVF